MDDLGLSGLKSAAIGIMDGAGADHSALLVFSAVFQIHNFKEHYFWNLLYPK